MRTYDFTPLYRATVGFDRMADLLDRVATNDAGAGYPPYNIEKTDEDAYRISIAVAGFTGDELTVEARQNALVVAAKKADDGTKRTYLHRGIATRAFERTFQLADHVQVTGARHENGMLHIELERQVPEALKPRRIAIAGDTSQAQAIEAEATETVEA
ncbi:Hsp20 family protein [Jannaschia sp. LMIT008]|uniref:Hsp20 family protein n=1 Tax=Jannaschia maritima TaxID=3032585 RepID=UPI0028114AA3|nr:Hsp20 family protein [Jannaschia sp. LMIT008]